MDSWVGILMLVIGVALLVAEAFVPGFFIVVPGTILVILGALAIVAPGLLTFPWGIIIFVVITVIVSFGTIMFYRRLAPGHKPLSTSMDTLVGQTGEVIKEVEPYNISGKVRIGQQIWSARSSDKIPVGEKVIVTKAQGVHVFVCKFSGKEAEECRI
ncbi:MAG TPA: NfeD family protein [Methanocella sp.]|nr:NfeD family protein [Methanocella sp.]